MTDVEFLNTEPHRIPGACPDCGHEAMAEFDLAAVFGGGMKGYGPVVFCVDCESE